MFKNKNAIAESVDVQLKTRSSRSFENGNFSRQCPRPQGLFVHGSTPLARTRVTPWAFPCVASGLASTWTHKSIIARRKHAPWPRKAAFHPPHLPPHLPIIATNVRKCPPVSARVRLSLARARPACIALKHDTMPLTATSHDMVSCCSFFFEKKYKHLHSLPASHSLNSISGGAYVAMVASELLVATRCVFRKRSAFFLELRIILFYSQKICISLCSCLLPTA